MDPVNLYNVDHFLANVTSNMLLKKESSMPHQTPWGPIGYPTYKRTYARPLDDQHHQTEEYPDTIQRVVQACNEQLKCGFDQKEQNELSNILLQLKGSVAGRFLWQLGTRTVDDLGLLSLQNCAGVVVDDIVRPFTWTFDALMLGSGVGFNIQRQYVNKLPKMGHTSLKVTHLVDGTEADFIVPDSREGWVQLLEHVMTRAVAGGKFSYSTELIRPYGTPIKGFGGTASGPEPLVTGIQRVVEVLNSRRGQALRPVDCLDIMNIIGKIVVAGNVRRTAMIALGDPDDLEYLEAKRWDLYDIPSWRAMSNNSVVCSSIDELPDEFWEGYKGNGEPYGMINIELSKKIGRAGDTRYPDPTVVVYNPCAEQSLANFETCCLAEVFLPNITSLKEFKKVLSYLYVICKNSLNLPCHHSETEAQVHANQRMGIGLTGVAQCTAEQLSWLDKGYKFLRDLDKGYSAKRGWPESVKLTTIKPSGTLSLLPGVTPGAHPGFAQYHIRRIRMAKGCALELQARECGYPVEPVRNFDGSEDPRTVVVEFPCEFPAHTRFAEESSAIDQLEFVKFLQKHWSDNAVSCTIYYRLEELDAIKAWLSENYTTNVKSVSFLLHSGHGFDQAPLEEISKEEYEQRLAAVRPITSVEVSEQDMEIEECAGGACPVK